MASSTARFAMSSLAPDIEPERSRTIARLTGARRRSPVGAGRDDAAPSTKRWLWLVARM